MSFQNAGMLFNSTGFILVFLPLVGLAFFLAPNERIARFVLILASMVFYAWWSVAFLGLIVAGTFVNFVLSRFLLRSESKTWSIIALAGGIILNLVPLFFFKYYDFAARSLNIVIDPPLPLLGLVLPLAISFYTFQKIALLVDSYHRQIPDVDFESYLLFVLFFPHLIAGPITSPREMLPQFANERTYRIRSANLAIGFSIFVIGLFKKVVIADTIAQYATPVFKAADAGRDLTFVDAWGGALAFTFQLYFDFSGYSEMALGLARMFNIRMPLNFFSPYKATSIRDFWRRWHMSLSWFLRQYVYIPLGGSRIGRLRHLTNLFLTMLIAGIWHGAGWTFVIFGALHGGLLVANQLASRWTAPLTKSGIGYGVAWLATFLAVVVGWVFFRAETVDGAMRVLAGMSGVNGVVLPSTYASALSFLGQFGIQFGATDFFYGRWQVLWLFSLLLFVLLAPNTPQIFSARAKIELADRELSTRFAWQPSLAWGIGLGVLAYFAISGIDGYSEFLYFNF